jgi:hypothetical protein
VHLVEFAAEADGVRPFEKAGAGRECTRYAAARIEFVSFSCTSKP